MLSRIGKDHPMYASGFSMSAVPPVEIGPTEFGNGISSNKRSVPASARYTVPALPLPYQSSVMTSARSKPDP